MDKREYRFDFLRVMSMFLVVVIHVANCYCNAFYEISHTSYLGGIIFNILARISVPIFL